MEAAKKTPAKHRPRALPLACFALIALGRLWTLAAPFPFNVDEAQWTVSARKILDDPIVWRSSDLTTSGPLNALVTSWPYLFGAVPSIVSSRLTGVVLLALTMLGVAALIPRRENTQISAAAVLTATLYLAFTTRLDFIHYNSELLSLALIAAFFPAYIGAWERGGWRWALSGVIAAALPFAKLQSALFALLFLCLCVCALYAERRRRRAGDWAFFAAGASAPALIFIAPLFLVGEQRAFFQGYLGLGADYGGARSLAILKYAWPGVVTAGPLLAMEFARLRRIEAAQIRWDLLIAGLLLWPVALVTMWWPGRAFSHYALYAIVALALSVALAQRASPAPEGRALALQRIGARAILIAMAALLATTAPRYAKAVGKVVGTAFAFEGAGAPSRPLFAWAGVTPADELLMWGWAPELTAYAELKSADRAAHAEYLIRPNRARAYFRNRLLAHIKARPPALIVDAVKPGYFFANYPGYRPAASGIASFPALGAFVAAGYEQVGDREDCAAIYLRRDLASRWRRAEIPLRTAASALTDSSTTETCRDWWSGPRAEFLLARPEPVGALWLLASRGGADRRLGATCVKVRFVTAAGTREEIVHLHDYPRWTVAPGPGAAPVSRFEIVPLTHVGEGPALSEVKAFRIAAWGG